MALHYPFRFFDLPGELRAAVLQHLVLAASNLPTVRSGNDAAPIVSTDLFLVCSQMYQEASGIFYTQNRFVIDLGTRRLCEQITEEGQLLSPQGQDARRRIRTLILSMKRIGGNFEAVIAPALSDMILCGSLRNLEIRFLPQNYGPKQGVVNRVQNGGEWASHPAEAGDLATTAPFRALLRLLGDPDLERVELMVWMVHWSMWCPFHDEVEGHGSCAQNMRRSGKMWARVDWKRMVEVWGDGNQIVKIR
jgi:hypothetical protein